MDWYNRRAGAFASPVDTDTRSTPRACIRLKHSQSTALVSPRRP